VIADDKFHLLRVREEDLEVVYVGVLLGAEYREIIAGGHVRIELWHERLESLKVKRPIVIEGPTVASDVQPLRTLFRGWAETPVS